MTVIPGWLCLLIILGPAVVSAIVSGWLFYDHGYSNGWNDGCIFMFKQFRGQEPNEAIVP